VTYFLKDTYGSKEYKALQNGQRRMGFEKNISMVIDGMKYILVFKKEVKKESQHLR